MSTPPDPSQPPRVGYLGPQGTFSEEAVLAGSAPGAATPVPCASIPDTVAALARGEVRWAVVPIENSLEGSINVTLDLVADRAGDVRIVGETVLRVRHSLIAAQAVALGEIETVLTHPQVPGQCRRFLSEELPSAQVLPASSTAEAVRAVVAAGDRAQAALGTPLAAQIYGATVLRDGVQDRDDNETRFVWLSRAGDAREPPPLRDLGGEPKTSLVFWGAGAEQPGWLVRCLDEFARRDVNLTKIESRPRRRRLGSYMFFADLAADAGEERVREALEALGGRCEEVRVLGSYRAAEGPTA